MIDPTNSRYRHLAFKTAGPYRRFIQEEDNQLESAGLTFRKLDIPVHGSYGALLFTKQWKIRREQILKRDFYSCVLCKSKSQLQIHHRQYHFVVQLNQYKLPWEYDDHLLVTLCQTCNSKGHGKFKVPTINI